MNFPESKDRTAGGFSVYANDWDEGIMVYTYDKDRKQMIPVWFDHFHCREFAKSVWYAQRHYWGKHRISKPKEEVEQR